jgi:hypothetical protein
MRWRDVRALLAVGALAGCAVTGTGAAPGAGAGTSVTTRATQSARHAPTAKPKPKPKPKPKLKPQQKPAALPIAPANAATLPQTSAFPSTTDTAFKNVIHDFWLAVTTGNPNYAKQAFFPEKAYEQVKAIPDPDSDWQTRLWYEFTLDVAAVHPLIGKNAKLLKVIVPAEYAIWIPPGACYNNIGYWHVPGSRVVYKQDGATKSFGVTSFISWRGDWYLVHLGALSRPVAVGLVDDPAPGPGVPGPPGGC